MPKGVTIENDTPGSGREACRGDVVVVNLRMFLNRGEEVTAEYPNSPRNVIDLGKREIVAGIRYGIEGMRSGGKRTFSVSPHLAYGAEGMGEWIPPNAVLRCEVELFEVHDSGYYEPQSPPEGRGLTVFIPGLAAESKARCQLSLAEEGQAIAFIRKSAPNGDWRRGTETSVRPNCNPLIFKRLFEQLQSWPTRFPEECLGNDVLWSDHSEPSNAITRDSDTDTPCITMSLGDLGQPDLHYSIRSNSRLWLDSATRADLLNLLSDNLRPEEIF